MDDAQWKVGPLPLLLILKSAPVVPGLEGFFFCFFYPLIFQIQMYSLGGPRKQITLPKGQTHTHRTIDLTENQEEKHSFQQNSEGKKVMFNLLLHNHNIQYVAEMQTKGDGAQ